MNQPVEKKVRPDYSKIPSPDIRWLAVFSILPAFLAGAEQRWSQGVVLVFLGIWFVVYPPKRIAGVNPTRALLAFWLIPFLAFLPAIYQPAWRQIGSNDLGLSLGGLVTPQPWITFDAILLFSAGLGWFYFTVSWHNWFDRRQGVKWMAGAISVFGITSLIIHVSGHRWVYERAPNFGPFANHNATGLLMAIGLVLSAASVYDELRHKNPMAIVWGLSCGLLFWSLLVVGSRAGLVLGIAGVAAWSAVIAIYKQSKIWFGVASGVVLALVGVWSLLGGTTLDRLFPKDISPVEAVSADERWLVQASAYHFGMRSPMLGVGLGNFEDAYQVSRPPGSGLHLSHVFHPESDWIFLFVEAGAFAVLAVVAATLLYVYRMLPLTGDEGWRIRVAAVVCSGMFLLHTFVDVSCHRMGTAIPCLLLCSLAMYPFRPRKLSKTLPLFFMGGGAVLLLVGSVWVYAVWTNFQLPGRIALEIAESDATNFNLQKNYDQVPLLATKGIKSAPLRWRSYFNRAYATAMNDQGTPDQAFPDFLRARWLAPLDPEVPFQEGLVWMKRKPALAGSAWIESANRESIYSRKEERFRRIADLAPAEHPELHRIVTEIALSEPQLLLVYLGQVDPFEFRRFLGDLRAKDAALASFSDEQKQRLFSLWLSKVGPKEFMESIEPQEKWTNSAWQALGESLVRLGNAKKAWEIAMVHVIAPALPSEQPKQKLGELRVLIAYKPQLFPQGYNLYCLQMRNDDSKAALDTLHKVTGVSNCPSYFFYLKAKLLADMGMFSEAWQSLKRGGFVKI